MAAAAALRLRGHGYWLRGFGQEQGNKRVTAGASRDKRRLCTYVPALLLVFSLQAEPGEPIAPPRRQRRHPPPHTTRKGHGGKWLLGPSSASPSPRTHADAATSPRQNNARALELLLSNAAASSARHSGTANTHGHGPCRLVGHCPSETKGPGGQRWCCRYRYCYCTSHAHAWTRRSRKLWVLGYNTATCCQDAFPPCIALLHPCHSCMLA